jgi:hypothetical protein
MIILKILSIWCVASVVLGLVIAPSFKRRVHVRQIDNRRRPF